MKCHDTQTHMHHISMNIYFFNNKDTKMVKQWEFNYNIHRYQIFFSLFDIYFQSWNFSSVITYLDWELTDLKTHSQHIFIQQIARQGILHKFISNQLISVKLKSFSLNTNHNFWSSTYVQVFFSLNKLSRIIYDESFVEEQYFLLWKLSFQTRIYFCHVILNYLISDKNVNSDKESI